MTSGLMKAGFNPLLAFDIDPPSVASHNENLGNHARVLDVKDVTVGSLLSEFRLNRGELPLFAGGPPCQGFSKQKRGAHHGDERNKLVLHYVRLVEGLAPAFFFFENVAIFGQKRGKEYVDAIRADLADYTIHHQFVNTADYGVAQTRERFVIVGQRKDVVIPFAFPAPTVTRWKTVREVIGNLPEPPEDYTVHPSYANHQRAKVNDENIFRFSFVPPGGGWQNIPFQHRLPCHQKVNSAKGGWPDVYGRLEWDGQCPTITGGFDSFSRGRFGHPEYNRPLTPREAARLQGFEDAFRFVGNRGDARGQIGNAVPPPLAEAVGRAMLRCFPIPAYTPPEARVQIREVFEGF